MTSSGNPPRIEIFTTPVCGYCRAAKSLLETRGLSFVEMDVTDPEVRAQISAKAGNWRTVPMIFIGDRFIGGYADLQDLAQSGELDRLTRPQA